MPEPSCIAIVDDDERVRHSLATLLRSLGLRTACYASASDLLASEAAVDCILTDLQMPGMSGIDLLVALKAAGRTTPLIIMTAFPAEMVRMRAATLGAVGFFDKPVDVDELIACLKLAISGFDVAP